jgi:CII-binding regulator of phage lambda lysogenization HflD
MRDSKTDAMKRIVFLIEAVHHAARMFAAAAADEQSDPPVRKFAEKIHEQVEQFEFELRTEMTRLAAEPVIVCETEDIDLRLGFEAMLESYSQALESNITPHTRAMINRQLEEIQKASDELAVTLPECGSRRPRKSLHRRFPVKAG